MQTKIVYVCAAYLVKYQLSKQLCNYFRQAQTLSQPITAHFSHILYYSISICCM